MTHCLTETWQPILIVGLISIIFGTSILTSLKNHISSLLFSRTTTLTVISYCILSISVLLFISALTPLLLTIGIGGDSISRINLSILTIKVFETNHVCIDLLTILTLSFTFIVVISSFIVAQILLHNFASKIDSLSSSCKSEEIREQYNWLEKCKVNVIEDRVPNAFSFTLLTFCHWRLGVEDRIVITTGMMDLLNENELETVLAHEYSHTVNQDTRYSHLVVTLSSLLFFDPIYKVFKKIMIKNQEFKADMDAMKIANKPISLARALYKLIAFNTYNNNPNIVRSFSLLDKDKTIVRKRIKNLLTYAKTNNINI